MGANEVENKDSFVVVQKKNIEEAANQSVTLQNPCGKKDAKHTPEDVTVRKKAATRW